MSVKQDYQAFIASVRKNGGRLLTFPCPCCQEAVETLAAPEDDVWDTMATCPYCEGIFMKVVTASQVRTYVPDGEQEWQRLLSPSMK